MISHGGGINGFNTIISRSISDKSLAVLLNNTGSAPLNDITRSIWAILSGKTYDRPKKSLAYDVLSVIQTKGIETGIAHFHANKHSDVLELNENEMNQIGYQLMGEDKIEEASQVFKLNMKAFPKSFNTYDSYAESLMKLGDKEGAIKNYKISIEMNPGNQNGIDNLEKLGVDISELVKEVIVPEDILNTYVGEYELMPGFIITISKEGQQLRGQATGQQMLNIYPKTNEVFYLKEIAAQLTFNKDEDGKVESLTLLQGGQEQTGKKLSE